MLTAEKTHRIVMVDDEADFLVLAREWLEPRYDVVTLSDGPGLIEVLAGLELDLVILDVRMEPDGFSVCRQMRADHRLKAVPVVFLTSSRSDMDFIRNIDAGGTAYLMKPISRKGLLSTLSRMIFMGS
ncbi:MAG: response regulator [Elusimicrobia bacterium]|nr:response regulator [Elusimicrobiota bacterium]